VSPERSTEPASATPPEAECWDRGSPSSLDLRVSGRHERLLLLREWIAKNGALQLTLLEAARISCLEPHYFSQIFREHVGESFRQWRLRYRISWALLAMNRGEQTLNDIIHASGYRNRRAFERAVKRITGMTPGRVRRRALGSSQPDLSALQKP
jgi:two-component system, response regulator YesN